LKIRSEVGERWEKIQIETGQWPHDRGKLTTEKMWKKRNLWLGAAPGKAEK